MKWKKTHKKNITTQITIIITEISSISKQHQFNLCYTVYIHTMWTYDEARHKLSTLTVTPTAHPTEKCVSSRFAKKKNIKLNVD